MADRGEYRSFYISFWDDPDEHALSDRAYRVLTTLKGTLPASGIGVVYTAQLAERCRATPKQIEAALVELETPKPGQQLGWIVRERNIVWIVNALRYEPNLYVTNEKHRTFVAKQLLPLGDRLAIVNQFRRYYIDWGLAQPSDVQDNGGGTEGLSNTLPDRVSPGVSDRVSKHIEVEEDVEGSVSGNGDIQEPSSSARSTPLHRQLVTEHDRAALDRLLGAVRNPETWIHDLAGSLSGMPGHVHVSAIEMGIALRDYVANGALERPNAAHFRSYLTRAKTAAKTAGANGVTPHRGIGARVAARTRAAIEDL